MLVSSALLELSSILIFSFFTSNGLGFSSVDFLEGCLADFVEAFADVVDDDFDDVEFVIDAAVAASVVSSGRSTWKEKKYYFKRLQN